MFGVGSASGSQASGHFSGGRLESGGLCQASDFGTGRNLSLSPPFTLPLPQQWPEPPWLPLRTWTSLCGWPRCTWSSMQTRSGSTGSGYGRGGPWPGPRGLRRLGVNATGHRKRILRLLQAGTAEAAGSPT